jgi:hypothetical protein
MADAETRRSSFLRTVSCRRAIFVPHPSPLVVQRNPSPLRLGQSLSAWSGRIEIVGLDQVPESRQ